MKPLVIVQMLPELRGGGVEEDAVETACYLASRGHVSLIVSGPGPMVARVEGCGARHLSLPVGEKSPKVLASLPPLRKLFFSADVVHLRSRVPAWAGMAAARSIPREKRPAVVTTFHGTYSVHAGSAVMAKGDRVIAISEFIAGYAKDNFGVREDRLVRIPGGFDEGRFSAEKVSEARREDMRRKLGAAAGGPPLVLLPGRITGWKGHRLFLQSLSLIKDFAWVAACAGDLRENPGYAEELRNLAADLGMGDRVLFAGHVSDMPAAYLAADVVVSASTEPEAFGRVAVEAQAMGRPVAATALGGSLETVLSGRTGFLCRPGCPEAMAAALARLVTDAGLRKRMGFAGRDFVHAHFTTRAMCERTEALYRELAGGVRERRAGKTGRV
ncbi:MAG: glycosyltransferase family 4 protein [Thermodesulfobacteriota bacterium]